MVRDDPLALERPHRAPPAAHDRIGAVVPYERIQLALQQQRPGLGAALLRRTGRLAGRADQLWPEHRLVEPECERLESLGEVVGVFRVELRESRRDVLRDDAHAERIKPVVRVALWVNVAHGAVDLVRRHLQAWDALRRVQMARRAHADLRVPRPVDDQILVADLQLQPDADPEIGVARENHATRLGVDEVRILPPGPHRRDLYLVAPDGLDDRAQVGGRGHDFQFRLRQRRRAQAQPARRRHENNDGACETHLRNPQYL